MLDNYLELYTVGDYGYKWNYKVMEEKPTAMRLDYVNSFCYLNPDVREFFHMNHNLYKHIPAESNHSWTIYDEQNKCKYTIKTFDNKDVIAKFIDNVVNKELNTEVMSIDVEDLINNIKNYINNFKVNIDEYGNSTAEDIFNIFSLRDNIESLIDDEIGTKFSRIFYLKELLKSNNIDDLKFVFIYTEYLN